jgi:outer membrane receptor protein involved in Fe transport
MTLKAGGMTETVEVSTASQMIQHTPAVQNLMGSTQVQELPLNNRNFVQLATLVPGVSSSLPDEVGLGLASTVSISINGQRRNAVNWLVDGAGNVDVGSNITLLNTPTLESIEEFKIITSSYAAEWPRSGGGIINVVTKSGTNEFRFVGYEFFRGDSLNANSFFRKQTGCQASGPCLDRSADGPPTSRPSRTTRRPSSTTTSASPRAAPSRRTRSFSSIRRSGGGSTAPPWTAAPTSPRRLG